MLYRFTSQRFNTKILQFWLGTMSEPDTVESVRLFTVILHQHFLCQGFSSSHPGLHSCKIRYSCKLSYIYFCYKVSHL